MKKILYIYITLLISTCFSLKAQNSIKNTYRVFLSKDTFLINTYSDKTLNIVADSIPIYKNATIKITFPKFFSNFAWDDMFWILIPPNAQAGYMKVKSASSGKKGKITSVNSTYNELLTTPSSALDYKFGHENNQNVITIKMLDTLPIGDTLQLIYGANGAATYTYNSMVAHTDRFCVLLDNQNNGNFTALNAAPNITFYASAAKNMSVVLPSTAKPNTQSLIKLLFSDIGRNIAYNFSGTVQLSCSDPSAVFNNTINITPADSGAKDVPIIFSQNGIFTVTAKVINSATPIAGSVISNPIKVSNDSLNIYWGELHTHGKISRDGFGDDGYLFARNGVGLDFFGATDHSDYNPVDTFGINRDEWATLKSKALQYNVPGRFVTFLSYENSLDNPSGHYNFIYNFDDSLVNNIPMLAKDQFYTIQNFWAKLNQLNQQGLVLTIPHHTGKLFGLVGPDLGASQFGGSFANATYKKSIEIYSGHGLGEYYNPNHNLAYDKFGGRDTKYPCFAQDAWALKEKLGVIASTDSHNGTPSQTNLGYAAVISDTLSRNKIFTNLANRHSYATTGERIVLKFTVNTAIMGDELSVQKDSFPTIKVEVIGTDNLDYIELLKWDFRNGTYTANPVHPNFQVIKKVSFANAIKNYNYAYIDTALRDTSMYYVRVKQKNIINNREVWAWSSPIWVNKPTSNSGAAYPSDSLYNFNLQYQPSKVIVNWCMKKELNTDYFVIERHNTLDTNFVPIAIIPTAHVAFFDSCYSYIDKYPNDTVMYYRVKPVTYDNGNSYSLPDSIRIPFVIDSVYGLKVNKQADRIGINWKANEFFAEKYTIEKQRRTTAFSPVATVYVDSILPYRTYSSQDFFPLKDTSYYRIWMDLNNGQHKISNVDTLFFIYDSMLNFKINAYRKDSILNKWTTLHEVNTQKYIVQRSQDKHLFLNIQELPKTGNIFDSITYNFIDTTALVGWNYYRIAQYISDGSIHYSPLDSVKIILNDINPKSASTNSSIKIIQNLIDSDKDYIDYILTQPHASSGTLLLVGIDGKIYLQEDSKFHAGQNIGKIPIGGLSSGLYYLLYITLDGMLKDNFIITFHGGCTH